MRKVLILFVLNCLPKQASLLWDVPREEIWKELFWPVEELLLTQLSNSLRPILAMLMLSKNMFWVKKNTLLSLELKTLNLALFWSKVPMSIPLLWSKTLSEMVLELLKTSMMINQLSQEQDLSKLLATFTWCNTERQLQEKLNLESKLSLKLSSLFPRYLYTYLDFGWKQWIWYPIGHYQFERLVQQKQNCCRPQHTNNRHYLTHQRTNLWQLLR